MSVIYIILIIINSLSLLLGIAVSVWAIILLAESENRILLELLEDGDIDVNEYDLSDTFNTVCFVSFVAGVVIVIVAILGLCGTLRESENLIAGHLFLLVLTIILALAGAIIAIVFAEGVHEDTKPLLKSRIIKEYTEIPSASHSFSDIINRVQVSLKCCGIDSYTDFNNANKWDHNNGTIKIPLTCCVLKNPDGYYKKPCAATATFATCQTAPTDANSYYKKA